MSQLTITSHHKSHDGHSEVSVALGGNLDNSTVSLLQSKLSPIVESKPSHLVFDLADLKYVTSAGMREFFLAAKQLKPGGGHVSFVNLQPQIKEVFEIMGSLPLIRVFTDRAELDAYLLARQKAHEE